MRRPSNISLLAALVLGSIFLAMFWAAKTPQSHNDPAANSPASCSTCDAHHRNLEKRSEIMRKLAGRK